MLRMALYNLIEWLNSSHRKPLILFGARQVGKTHLARMLGQHMPSFVEINLEKHPETAKIFEQDLDPARIIRDLSLLTDSEIIPGKTLLFLDEIQEVPRSLTALRYFYEEMPELHVIAAGSLLDFAIEQVGVPVGRVTFRWIYPLSFIEYLCALGYKKLAEVIIKQEPSEGINEAIHDKALTLLGEYMAVGGMPEAVRIWRDEKNIEQCQEVHSNIISAYKKDFPKYAKKYQIKYVELLFEQLPRFISTRFKYSLLETSYQKRELEPAMMLLEKARVLHIIQHAHGNGIPLRAESDSRKFKIIMLDVALTQASLKLPIKNWFLDPSVNLVNKGEVTEAFIGQELLAYNMPNVESQLYYWHREARGSQAEVDYLFENKNVLPIEVKSGHGASLQSLRLFLNKRPQTPYGIRFSVYNYSFVDKLQNYPLYAVACLYSDNKYLTQLIDQSE